jgi:hypothetical protein
MAAFILGVKPIVRAKGKGKARPTAAVLSYEKNKRYSQTHCSDPQLDLWTKADHMATPT